MGPFTLHKVGHSRLLRNDKVVKKIISFLKTELFN